MKLAMRIGLNVFAGVTGQILLALLGLVTIGILTRSLGPADFGNYRTVLAYLSLVGVFANFGTHTLALREMSRNGADQPRLIGSALALRLILTTLLLLLGVLFAPLFALSETVVKGLIIGLFGWVAYQVNEVTVSVFFYRMQQHMTSMAEVVGTAVSCLLVIVFAALDRGLYAMLLALVAGQFTTAVLAWSLASRSMPLRPVLDLQCWRFYLEAGWPLGASIVVNVMIMRADTMLLAMMNPAEDVGYYGVGIKITEILTSVAMLFANLVMPLLVQAVDLRDEFRRYVSGSLRVMLIVSLLIVYVLMYFCADIIRLIAGSGYEAAVDATRVLSLAVMAYFVTSAYRMALTAMGEQRAMLAADLWGFAIAIPAYGVLIYLGGLEGAAWARVLANAAIMLAAGWVLVRRIGTVFPAEILWKLLAASLLVLSIFVGLDHLGCYWMVNIALGSAAYVASLILGGAIPLDLFLARRSDEPG